MFSAASVESSSGLRGLVFTRAIGTGYAHLDHQLHSTVETIEHRILRSRKSKTPDLPEFPFQSRPVQVISNQWTDVPPVFCLSPLKVSRRICILLNFFKPLTDDSAFQVSCRGFPVVCSDRSAAYWLEGLPRCGSLEGENLMLHGSVAGRPDPRKSDAFIFQSMPPGGIEAAKPKQGWSNVILPGLCLKIFQNVFFLFK